MVMHVGPEARYLLWSDSEKRLRVCKEADPNPKSISLDLAEELLLNEVAETCNICFDIELPTPRHLRRT